MAKVEGTLVVNGLARNGITANLYNATGFASPPSGGTLADGGTALPTSGIVATLLTGPAYGGDGAYRFDTASGEWYIGINFNGIYCWDYFNVPGLSSAIFNVRDYGTVGDGASDDTTAIQNAINAAAAQGKASNTGNEVYFPPGKYLISSPLILPRTGNTPTSVVKLRGANCRSAWIQGDNSLFPANRGLIEWASGSATPCWHQSIQSLRMTLPNVSGTMGIYFLPSGDVTSVSNVLAQKLMIDIDDVLIEGNNDYHTHLVYLRGNVTMSRIHGLWGDCSQGSLGTNDTYTLEFDTSSGSVNFGGDDQFGFHYGEISAVYGGVRRGGYSCVMKGRFHRSVLWNCHQGINAQVQPAFSFWNSTACTMRNFTLEGGASQPQVQFNKCRNLNVEFIGAGSAKVVNGHIPGNGIEVSGCQDIRWTGELRRSGNPVFSTSGHYLLFVDATCQRCVFKNIDTNGPLSGEVSWNPPVSGDCYIEAWDTTNLAFSTIGREGDWQKVRNIRTVTTVSGASNTVTEADDIILSNPTLSGTARTFSLATPATIGRRFIIKDAKGNAASGNITVSGVTGTIDGWATDVISTNYGAANYVWDGTNWYKA